MNTIKKRAFKFCFILAISYLAIFLFSFTGGDRPDYSMHFPYKQAGLTNRQAAAHLLSRFTFGAQPGQIDEILAMGLENWFRSQLNASLPDEDLNKRLQGYDALKLSNAEIVAKYLRPAQILKMAIKDGVVDKDSVSKEDKAKYRAMVATYMLQNGLKPQKELFRQLANQKILRASYSNNQLQEVMTDFWFNHFNVSMTKNICAEFIPVYERDVIRSNALGKFYNLLLATAKSPAMLTYLDNFNSSGVDSTVGFAAKGMMRNRGQARLEKISGNNSLAAMAKLANRKRNRGLNENYAREVMELHTLGVDGGYTQNDVTAAARVLTGWTVYPIGNYGPANAIKNVLDKIGGDRLAKRGFVREGDFLFAANRHDKDEKVVLGKTFKDGGYSEGEQLLEMLAHHPSTARFISRKLAVRFVSDNPPQALVDGMAKTFAETGGDIKQVLLTMVSTKAFWSKSAIREKTKSPFELAISSIRSLQADIRMPYQLYNWIDKMGQKMYFYQAPTGFPDKAQYWINTGSLLNRMNFGLALATQKIPGIKIDLLALNNGHEPESAEAALVTYGKLIMPERDLSSSVARLKPLLTDPILAEKIERKAAVQPVLKQNGEVTHEVDGDNMKDVNDSDTPVNPNNTMTQGAGNRFASSGTQKENNNMLSQVVGIIIGSPEFQRR